MKESQLQQAIKDALILAGFTVLHTSAFRQKGPSGCSPGVPDLLVTHELCRPNWIGIEVKTQAGRLSPAQKVLADGGLIHVARTPVEAVSLSWLWFTNHAKQCPALGTAAAKAERALNSLSREAVSR